MGRQEYSRLLRLRLLDIQREVGILATGAGELTGKAAVRRNLRRAELSIKNAVNTLDDWIAFNEREQPGQLAPECDHDGRGR